MILPTVGSDPRGDNQIQQQTPTPISQACTGRINHQNLYLLLHSVFFLNCKTPIYLSVRQFGLVLMRFLANFFQKCSKNSNQLQPIYLPEFPPQVSTLYFYFIVFSLKTFRKVKMVSFTTTKDEVV